MDQAPPKPQSTVERPVDGQPRDADSPSDDHRSFKEAVETAASAYFSACRKLARTINRLKQR